MATALLVTSLSAQVQPEASPTTTDSQTNVGPALSSVLGQSQGRLSGRVTSKEAGAAVAEVTISLSGTELSTISDSQGDYRFDRIKSGTYTVVVNKAGFAASEVPDVEIKDGETLTLDFILPSQAPKPGDDVIVLEAYESRESGPSKQIKAALVRLESDKLVNLFTSEDFAKFAAGDVAAALSRVAGVNVVEGQFAIIRGLEDRYSSTLYNNSAIPSPDPNSQSVQLDLFPSDVVSDLVIAKTFAGDLPGNSAGGSINIVTHDYPKGLEMKLGASTGFNENAAERFVKFAPGTPFGTESSASKVTESDLGFSVAGRRKFERLGGREVRLKAVFSHEIDFDTKLGVQEGREPQNSNLPRVRPGRPTVVTPQNHSGDLAFGLLSLSDGRFELTDSTRTEQTNAYLGFGLGLDVAGKHRIDASVFYTRKAEEQVQLKENGFIPGYDYAANAPEEGNDFSSSTFDGFATLGTWVRDARSNPLDTVNRGHLHFTNLNESLAYERERDLLVFQINGDHRIQRIEGLHVGWALNQAKTTQEENAFGAEYFFEPANKYQFPTAFPAARDDLAAGVYAVNKGLTVSDNTIDENQDFGRLDADYRHEFSRVYSLMVNAGGSWEKSSREVESNYLESPSVAGSSEIGISDPTLATLGTKILNSLDRASSGSRLSGLRLSTNDSLRDIKAFNLGLKNTLFKNVDVFGSARFEEILIRSTNSAFTGENSFDAPQIYPSRYLFFDRYDNPARGEVAGVPLAGTTFNDQLLGIDVPVGPTGLVDLTTRDEIQALIDGRIDRQEWLPSIGVTARLTGRLTVRAAWSRTIARPSFREIGYYVSVDPGSSDLTVGNPQLKLSEVESWDARAEYTWGEKGDLIAFSAFRKLIDTPIESIVIRDPGNFEGSGGLYRTFFNNPNQAELLGLEFEARKDFGFLGFEFAEHFSLGGNVTYIDAEVDRTAIELARSTSFFSTLPDTSGTYTSMAASRRLYSQPEWIANADFNFDHPGWGTTATLAVFAISDILNAAGSASFGPNGQVFANTLDRYTAEFSQVDLILGQKWRKWTLRFSVKNLTDSTRKIVYDPAQLAAEIAERAYTVGRDYTLSASYQF